MSAQANNNHCLEQEGRRTWSLNSERKRRQTGQSHRYIDLSSFYLLSNRVLQNDCVTSATEADIHARLTPRPPPPPPLDYRTNIPRTSQQIQANRPPTHLSVNNSHRLVSGIPIRAAFTATSPSANLTPSFPLAPPPHGVEQRRTKAELEQNSESKVSIDLPEYKKQYR